MPGRLGPDPRRLCARKGRRGGGARDAAPARAHGRRVRAGARRAASERDRMSADPSCAASATPEHCITCGDEAVEMRVLEISDGATVACAGEDGAVHEGVAVELVEPVAPG